MAFDDGPRMQKLYTVAAASDRVTWLLRAGVFALVTVPGVVIVWVVTAHADIDPGDMPWVLAARWLAIGWLTLSVLILLAFAAIAGRIRG